MAVYYFDASALVKYYVPEPGSAWVRQLLDAQDPIRAQPLHLIFVAEITRVEVAAGLAVIERVGRLRRTERIREYQRFTSHLTHRYAIIPLTTEDFGLLARFGDSPRSNRVCSSCSPCRRGQTRLACESIPCVATHPLHGPVTVHVGLRPMPGHRVGRARSGGLGGRAAPDQTFDV